MKLMSPNLKPFKAIPIPTAFEYAIPNNYDTVVCGLFPGIILSKESEARNN